jgi:hypothetical protein
MLALIAGTVSYLHALRHRAGDRCVAAVRLDRIV